ncbi:MAG: hypothetical protein ACNS63_01650 [Candidatus Nitrospinota bacterium M3_3B_026]
MKDPFAASRIRDDVLKKLFIIWAAMLGGVGVYAAVTLFFISAFPPVVEFEGSLLSMARAVLAVMAAGNIGVMYYLDRRYRSREGIRNFLEGRGATALPVDITVAVRDEDKKALAVTAHYFQALIIRWALVETVAVYGLMLALVSREIVTPSFFYLVSAVFLGKLKPGRDELDRMIRLASSGA